MQIVNLSEAAILFIAEAATRADNEGRRMRLSFGQTNGVNSVAYKVGEGMWSAPFYDQPDPYRDEEPMTESQKVIASMNHQTNSIIVA
jgi:hypothetical protein